MAKIWQETRYEIGAGEVLELRVAPGQDLFCSSGELWLTVGGSADDVILAPGDGWRASGKADLVVSAFLPGVLVVSSPARAGRSGSLLRLPVWQSLAA